MGRKFIGLLFIFVFAGARLVSTAQEPAPGASSYLAGTAESFLASCRTDVEDGKKRIAALKVMEAGKAEFKGFGSAMFFNALLQITMEGFFADPIYGGNRDMVSWKMVGYPGLPATYRNDIKKYAGKKYDKPPRSIADFS